MAVPGYNIPSAAEAHRFTLTQEDAVRAARARVIVAPTAALNQRTVRDPERIELVRRVQVSNLTLLKDARVQIIVGSDNVEDTGAAEFEYLASLGVFTKAELLRLWSETTPQAIFPGRRIGLLRDGYEASFLALSGNPLDDLGNVTRITLRYKQGLPLP